MADKLLMYPGGLEIACGNKVVSVVGIGRRSAKSGFNGGWPTSLAVSLDLKLRGSGGVLSVSGRVPLGVSSEA